MLIITANDPMLAAKLVEVKNKQTKPAKHAVISESGDFFLLVPFVKQITLDCHS